MLETALSLIRNKINIFPCGFTKQPLCGHGFKDATCDETQINEWWAQWPDVSIGMPTGVVNGVVVLDVDIDDKKEINGEESLQALLENNFADMPVTRTVRTPRGGKHLYFDSEKTHIRCSTSKIGKGLDIKGDGGYVILPPSRNGTGKSYVLEIEGPIAHIPGWLKDLIVEPERKEPPAPPTTARPYNATTDRTKIETALSHISPSCPYADWIQIGMALFSWDSGEGRYIWDAWSRRSEKYEEGLIDVKWRTFKSGPLTIATLFNMAKAAGWKPVPMLQPDSPPSDSATSPSAAAAPEAFFYQKYSKEYLICNKRKAWLSLNENQFKKELAHRGLNNRIQKGESISEADSFIIKLRDTKDIDYSGPLAGYSAGFYDMNGYRVLVTESPKIIHPKEAAWPTIDKFIAGLLYDPIHDQSIYLMGWLKLAYESLRNNHHRPGQAMVICGPHDCGKSLLQLLITKILGGRSAKPYSYMTGSTDFNGDLFAAEHLCIEDEPAVNDLRVRRAFGAQIKQITGCDTQRCHAKFQQAITLPRSGAYP